MRKTTILFLWLWATLLLFSACSHKSGKRPSVRAVYYWATQFDIDSAKRNFLTRHDISRMYVRYFDVVADRSGQPMPNATLRFLTPTPNDVEIVPTVFVMPECLRGDNRLLAQRIVARVKQMNATNDVKGVKEMQIDCDWTASTRHAYNLFMAEMLRLCHSHNMRLSSTIRLHQLSQAPPPADRGVLMMYNTGDVTNPDCHKPILNMRDAAPYLSRLNDYKLPLSTAYPVFAWRVLFRGRQFVGILHSDDDYPQLPTDSVCLRQPTMDDIR